VTLRLPSPRSGSPEGDFAPSGFFALRTPLLPFDDFLAWSEGLEAMAAVDDAALLERALAADRTLLRDRLRRIIARPLIRDALFIASPDLDESMDVWIRDPESERGQRIERAIVRYFSRMAGRPTPFGLFAGSSVGRIGGETRLVLDGREKYERHSRFDMDYLFGLVEALGKDVSLRGVFRFRPNSSLYRAAGRVHYVEARLDGKERTHHLVAVEDSDELRETLERSSEGAGAEELALPLVGGDVSRSEAEEYVGELIASQILRPDLALQVTGPDPSGALARQLKERPETAAIGDHLEEARSELAAMDAAGPGADPARYRDIARRLEALPAPVALARLFQVDMTKPSPEARLGGAVLEEIVRGIDVLSRLARPPTGDALLRFREAFQERYEKREVALTDALDEETGIGFSPSENGGADEGPLLKGLDLAGKSAETVPWGARERFLLEKLARALAEGTPEISLTESDLEPIFARDPPPMPDAFAVLAFVAAASDEALSRGDFRVLWAGTDGPSGARMLGRFCQADPILRRHVEDHLRAEEALDPEAVFAEIVHLPEGRIGNILLRPVLRSYEIPYLGRSGAAQDRQIPITDLFVSVVGDQVVLRSQRLNRRVIPRLTSAHNFDFQGLGLYRFLGELQRQGRLFSLGWDWTPLWSAPFLPRVTLGRLVLSPARWTISRTELKRLGASRGIEGYRAVQSWRVERRLPRWVVLSDGDNKLPIDLDNVLSVEAFVHLVKDRADAALSEMAPGPEEICARGPEGRFLHELVIPFVRKARVAADARPVRPQTLRTAAGFQARTFAPGSEWIYAKLYASASNADRLLGEIVGPLARKALESAAADLWFFIRYGDPQWHLRVRFRGDPARLVKEVLSALHEAAAPLLAGGSLWKIQLDTYEREVERYGGVEGIALAERVFQADSEAVLEILELIDEGDAGADERWRLAIAGVDRLLGDFGLELEARRSSVEAARRQFEKNLDAEAGVRRQIGERFRKESKSLELLLDPSRDSESSLAPGLAILRNRSDRLAPLVEELRALERTGRLSLQLAELVPSVVHMHVNRILRSGHHGQELVLYDFLARLYETRAIRAQRQS
jgi:lantibiotic biosynthesis protein